MAMARMMMLQRRKTKTHGRIPVEFRMPGLQIISPSALHAAVGERRALRHKRVSVDGDLPIRTGRCSRASA
jgi:hypothetical protein